ncbi:MAG: hypothetical protein WCP64_03150 [Actinomycetes bacterium]
MAQITTTIQVQTGPRDRSATLLRGILVFPVLVFLGAFATNFGSDNNLSYSAGMVLAPAFLALLVRGKYPSYVLTFNHAVMELNARVGAYLFLLTDDYPSIEANPKIAVEFPDVAGGKALNQFAPLFKWFLAIPLYIVGAIYFIYALIVTFVAWLSTIASGIYPEWAIHPVLGTIQYWNRVYGYAFVLVTDEYPSFSL